MDGTDRRSATDRKRRIVKITFVSPFASLAGGTRVMAIYARILTERGHHVTVVSQPHNDPPTLRSELVRLLRNREKPLPRAPTPLLDFLGDRHIVLERRRPVRATDLPDADVVIATWWTTAEWVADLPPEKGRKYQLLQDYEVFDTQPVDRVVATYATPLRKMAVSGYIRDQVRKHPGTGEIVLLPNAVDTDQFDVPVRAKNDTLTVGFLYTLKRRKNIALIVQALQKVKEQIPELRALALSARAISEKLPLPDWVEVTVNPAQDRIPLLYASCDLWLLSSKDEGFGLPLLEAMACRTPVLSTAAGAAPDLIDGTNGYIVAPTVDAFVDHMETFREMTPTQWQTFSQAAYLTAHAYTWQDATDLLLDYLQPQTV